MSAVLALLSAVALGVGGVMTTQNISDATVAAQQDKEPVVSVQEIKSDGDAGELGW